MQWYENCYGRLLIDNHIAESDPLLMSRFDPAQYVDMVKTAEVETAMVYACCHNGNCYYPTKVGHMHANLGGRDIFGETVALLRKEGIVPTAYYTTIFHNHSAKTNPSWRMEDPHGEQHGGRYWYSCPNSRDFREFTNAVLADGVPVSQLPHSVSFGGRARDTSENRLDESGVGRLPESSGTLDGIFYPGAD